MEIRGIYKSFDQIPSDQYSQYPVVNSIIPEPEIQEYRDVLGRLSNPNPTIVDFGGGNGKYYEVLNNSNSTYYVVETPQVCKKLDKNQPNCIYTTSILNISMPIDLFVSNGGLQYYAEPSILLEYVKQILVPEYILLQRLWTSRNNKSYATLQVFSPYHVPTWVIYKYDLIKWLSPEYDLVYNDCSKSMRSIFDIDLITYIFKRI